MKQRKRRQLGTLPLEDILPILGKLTPKGNYIYSVQVDGETYQVKTGSHRLAYLRNHLVCVHCGRIGVKFILEQDEGHIRPHLNLYTQDNILMTLDHVIPKSKGGMSIFGNYQTLCEECNGNKADKLPQESEETRI